MGSDLFHFCLCCFHEDVAVACRIAQLWFEVQVLLLQDARAHSNNQWFFVSVSQCNVTERSNGYLQSNDTDHLVHMSIETSYLLHFLKCHLITYFVWDFQMQQQSTRPLVIKHFIFNKQICYTGRDWEIQLTHALQYTKIPRKYRTPSKTPLHQHPEYWFHYIINCLGNFGILQ